MTTVPNQSSPAAAAGTFDPSTIESLANQMAALLVQFEALVPDLQPHDARVIKRVAQTARFTDPLLAPTVNTVNSVSIVPPALFNVDRAKQALMYRDYLRPLAQRLLILGGAVNFSVDSKLALSGEDLLQVYAWAQRAVNGPNGAVLRPWFDEMQRMMKKAINRRKKSSGPAAPPAPHPMQGFLAMRGDSQPETGELELPEHLEDLFDGFDDEE